MADPWRITRIVDALFQIPRIGWVSSGVKGAETVAQHIMLTAYLAIAIAREAGLNVGKAALLALIHDLPEAELGNPSRGVREAIGMDKWRALESSVASSLGLGEFYGEYSSSSSAEAQVVKLSDKLATFIRACEYLKMGYDTGELVEYYRGEVLEALKSLDIGGRAKEYVLSIINGCRPRK